MGGELSDIGEFGLIERLLARIPGGENVIVGPGDDAAVVRAPPDSLLATADMLIEGRHFDLAFSSPHDAGYKALTVNVSDIAAMGGRPTFALVSLGVPKGSSVETVEQIYDGLSESARAFGVAVVGGDTVASDVFIISIALLGTCEHPVLRSGARAGDVLCVTGPLGAASAGLALLRAAFNDPVAQELLERYPHLAEAHRRGRARVETSRHRINAMIDISDGLAQDVTHICDASGVGAVLDTIPIADGVDAVADWAGRDPSDFALHGGDDYELALAVPPEAEHPHLVVGRFVDGSGLSLSDGTPVEARGWDHFA